jgi:hypothetical protein
MEECNVGNDDGSQGLARRGANTTENRRAEKRIVGSGLSPPDT